jgi:hypothetical protein
MKDNTALNSYFQKWGLHCPAVGIHSLKLEYDRGQPAALVEYKHENAESILTAHPSVRALTELANRASIPFFIVRYANDFSWFYVTPCNDRALAILPEATQMKELEWVKLLYRCRGREFPEELSSQLV